MQGLTPRSSPAAAAARQQPSVRSRWVITDHGSPFGGRLCSSMHGCLRLWRVQLGGGGAAGSPHDCARWLAVQLHLLYAVPQLHAAVVRHAEVSVNAIFPCGCTPFCWRQLHLKAERQLFPGKSLRAAAVGVPCIQPHSA